VLPVKASITGIHAAITASAGDVVAVAWDMPFVPTALVEAMIQAVGQSGSQAAVPVVSGKPEPLCAAYSKSAGPLIAAAVRDGLLKNSDVLARLPNVVWIEESELRQFGDPAVMFFNVNTPADLTKAEEIARAM
jgi:molybdopterin-guanine dinucleotide biosynthesis protein A